MDTERIFKFLLVVCCFINAFPVKDGLVRGKKDHDLLKIAMGLTVAADLLMVILNINIFGILIFCAVQAVHNYRFTNLARVKVQAIVGAVVFAGAFLLSGFNLIFSAGCAYAIFTIYSLTGAFMAWNKYPAPNNTLVVVGMVLFLLCDIFVMINSLPILEMYGEKTLEIVNKGIWLCYLPAQVMLSSSARVILVEEK